MPTHNDNPIGAQRRAGDEPEPEAVDTSLGYEASDVKVTGILVFMVSLGIFVAVTGLVCYGIGKVINAHMDHEDGPNSKWTKTVEIRQSGQSAIQPRDAEQGGGDYQELSSASRPD